MVKIERNITRMLTAAILMLVIVVGLLPTAALAAESDLTDWYFLFAIFKSVDADCADGKGTTTHTKYTMTQDEVDIVRENAKAFETYMNQFGVMRAHVDVVEIDAMVTELEETDLGSCISATQATPLLEDKGADLDKYDHVTCVVDLNVSTSYGGITPSVFKNGTGESCVNLMNLEYALERFNFPTQVYPTVIYVHEFLHFMERMGARRDLEFDLHGIMDEEFYAPDEYDYNACYKDIILNQAKGSAELGTGVSPVVWQYPPRMSRIPSELTIPDGITTIGKYAFQFCATFTEVTIPSSVTNIKYAAFGDCTALTEVTIPPSVTNIEEWAFARCTALTRVSIPSSVTSIEGETFYECESLRSVIIPVSVTSIGDFAFGGCSSLCDIYYSGSKEQWGRISIGSNNSDLTNATIHYNSVMEDVKISDFYAEPVVWALEKGITAGTNSTNYTFSPNVPCTQAQILTFLWRAKGEPKPAAAVNSSEYYANAAQWAKERGLIDDFSAESPCTRAMIVTYLWKLAGSLVEGARSFTDVPADSSYAQAVTWAVKNGVTFGMGDGTFAPDAICTRAQIVTFLYRALA